MNFIFDYTFLHLLSFLLVVLKFAGFTTYGWWVIFIPSILALILYIIDLIFSR